MARLNMHHITYNPEWTVEITNQMHRCISRIQITRATDEQYMRLVNFQHAISYETNRMRQELDVNLDAKEKVDLRVVIPKGRKKIKRTIWGHDSD